MFLVDGIKTNMRLKMFFFPSMLIISVSLAVGFVQPLYQDYLKAKQDNVAKMRELEGIEKSMNSVRGLADDLAKNSSKVEAVNQYFPQSPKEDEVLNTVNYLASSSGVLLSDVTMEKEAASLPVAPVAAGEATMDPNKKQAEEKVPLSVKFFTVKISVAGEYDKIQMFVDSLQKSRFYVSVAAYEVGKNEKSTTDDPNGKEKNEKILLGNIVLRVGYSASLKNATYANINFESPTVDFSVLDDIASASSQSVPALNLPGDGRNNPFLP